MFARSICTVLFALSLLAAAGAARATKPSDLVFLQGIEPAMLGTKISPDTADGLPVVRIDTNWPTTINLTEIDVGARKLEDTVLKYTAAVKAENLEGAAFLEMWVTFPDGNSYFSRGLDNTVSGTANWTELATPFLLKEGETPERITLNIVINGKGTVWVKSAALNPQ